MASGPKLLEKLRRSPGGHSARTYRRLLTHYGFTRHEGQRHTIYGHELLEPGEVVVVPRSRNIRAYVARRVVAAIDSIVAATQEEAHDGEDR